MVRVDRAPTEWLIEPLLLVLNNAARADRAPGSILYHTIKLKIGFSSVVGQAPIRFEAVHDWFLKMD